MWITLPTCLCSSFTKGEIWRSQMTPGDEKGLKLWGGKRRGERGRQRRETREKGPPYAHGNWILYGLISILKGKVENCFRCPSEIGCVLEGVMLIFFYGSGPYLPDFSNTKERSKGGTVSRRDYGVLKYGPLGVRSWKKVLHKRMRQDALNLGQN